MGYIARIPATDIWVRLILGIVATAVPHGENEGWRGRSASLDASGRGAWWRLLESVKAGGGTGGCAPQDSVRLKIAIASGGD